MPHFRDRIRTIRTVKAEEIEAHPYNWRQHPPEQRAEMEHSLQSIGNVDVLKVVEKPEGGYLLIDGHLRRELIQSGRVRVAVLDLDEQETLQVLESFDRIGAMAQTDEDKLRALLASIAAGEEQLPETDEEAVEQLMGRIASEQPHDPASVDVADDVANRVASHMRQLAQASPELLQRAAAVVVPMDGICEALVIADPDLHDIVRELRTRHEDGETHPLDRLFDCIWTPADA